MPGAFAPRNGPALQDAPWSSRLGSFKLDGARLRVGAALAELLQDISEAARTIGTIRQRQRRARYPGRACTSAPPRTLTFSSCHPVAATPVGV